MNAIAVIDAEFRKQAAQRQKDLAGTRKTSPSKEGKVANGESAGETAEALGVSKSTVERAGDCCESSCGENRLLIRR